MTTKAPRIACLLLTTTLAVSAAQAQGVCPDPGDVAPGTLDESTDPPTWNIEPDGLIGIGDVVALLRTSVGIQQLAPPPIDLYVVIPGITSGATFRTNTERDCPTDLTLPMSTVVDVTDPPPGGPLSAFLLDRYEVSFRNITQGGESVPGVDVPQPFLVTVNGVVGADGTFPDVHDIPAGTVLPQAAKTQPPLNDDAFYLDRTDPLTGVVLEADIRWWGHPVAQPSLEYTGVMVFRFTVYDAPDGSAMETMVCAEETDC